jgi:hypothetical protein
MMRIRQNETVYFIIKADFDALICNIPVFPHFYDSIVYVLFPSEQALQQLVPSLRGILQIFNKGRRNSFLYSIARFAFSPYSYHKYNRSVIEIDVAVIGR